MRLEVLWRSHDHETSFLSWRRLASCVLESRTGLCDQKSILLRVPARMWRPVSEREVRWVCGTLAFQPPS